MKCSSRFKCIFDIIQEVCTIYFSVADQKFMKKQLKEKRVDLGSWFRAIFHNSRGGVWSTAAVSLHKKFKADLFHNRHKGENCKWGETVNTQSPTPMIYNIPQCPVPKYSIISTTNWQPSIHIPEPWGTFLFQTTALWEY